VIEVIIFLPLTIIGLVRLFRDINLIVNEGYSDSEFLSKDTVIIRAGYPYEDRLGPMTKDFLSDGFELSEDETLFS